VDESRAAMRSTVADDGFAVMAGSVSAESASLSDRSRLLRALRRIFSFPALLGSLLVGAVFVPARLFFVDPDTWWHIKVGESILATHRWPTTDPYSFTVSGQPWIAYEWLGEVLWAGVMRLGGIRGLEILLIVLGSAVMLALYGYATLSSKNSKAAFVACTVLFILANASFTLRPQMLGYLFLILTMICLELFREGRRAGLWFLPLVFLLWVNTHGSFVIGLGAILVYWLCGLKDIRWGGIETKRWSAADRRSISLVFLLCVAVLPITPYFTQLAVYPFDMAFSQPTNVANIQEWHSISFEPLGGKLFLGLLLAFIVCQIALRLTWRLEELVLALFGTAMACVHVRFLLIFVPFFAPLLTKILARWVPPYDRLKDRFILNAAMMIAVLWGVVHFLPSRTDIQAKIAEEFPVRAVEYLQTHPVPGPVYNNYGYGGYLVWTLAPGHKDFIDGRGDVFERGGVFADYMHISLLRPGAFAVLSGYGIRSCLLQRDEPLAAALAVMPNWKTAYSDSRSVLFVRTDAPPNGRDATSP
jgi:hypothetical protein